MKKQTIVLSLGGSLIIPQPEKINTKYLKKFKQILIRNKHKYNFVVVCGGGSIARTYITALKKINSNTKLQNFSGISATRMNARFMSYFFGFNPEKGIPHKMRQIRNYLRNQNIVFCGALEYKPNQTSDSTAAEIAKTFKAKSFINLTNVKGLYTKNPKKYKDAKLIKKITWEKFDKIARSIKYKPGQHFVLDQNASKIIKKHKIPTYILRDTKQLDNVLKEKKFIGTLIKE